MELTADNKGKKDENFILKISQVPKGWRASLKAPNFTVDAVPVPATKIRTLTFLAEPDKTVKPGNYQFQVDAQTEDGKFTSLQKINVTVREKTAMGEDFTVTTSPGPRADGRQVRILLKSTTRVKPIGTSTFPPRLRSNGNQLQAA
jgi:uncharacterized membrane protein